MRVVVFFSAVFSLAMTLLTTLAALLYNLISDVVGGVEVVMLEETLTIPQVGDVRNAKSWVTPGPVDVSDGDADMPTEPHDVLDAEGSDFFEDQPDSEIIS